MVKIMKVNFSGESSPANQLLSDLKRFQNLKKERWDQLEDSIQMANRLGTPSEDWIIPPDEKKVERVLRDDPDYVQLRDSIVKLLPIVIDNSAHQGFDLKHRLDWIKFTDPLIGTSAIEDAIETLTELTRRA